MPTQWEVQPRKGIVTSGRIGSCETAFAYIGVTPEAAIKVGMTSDPERRAKELGVTMVHTIPVRPEAARALETEILQRLGQCQGDGEWLSGDVEEVIRAAEDAADALRRRQWIDPHLTEDEARRLRVSLGLEGRQASEITGKDYPDKRISITSFRRAAGYRGAHGGRF